MLAASFSTSQSKSCSLFYRFILSSLGTWCNKLSSLTANTNWSRWDCILYFHNVHLWGMTPFRLIQTFCSHNCLTILLSLFLELHGCLASIVSFDYCLRRQPGLPFYTNKLSVQQKRLIQVIYKYTSTLFLQLFN